MDFFEIRFWDILDIILVSFVLYQVYRVTRGYVALNVYLLMGFLLLLWQLAQSVQMEIIGHVLQTLFGILLLALIVVFQPEIRRFLFLSKDFSFWYKWFKSPFFMENKDAKYNKTVEVLAKVCDDFQEERTGALIVIEKDEPLDEYVRLGDEMDIEVNVPIIESIFYKNSPLHDGAMLIKGNKIVATRVILPVSVDPNIPSRLGMRHRAAFGISERCDALCVVVSEETGKVSVIHYGKRQVVGSYIELKEILYKELL